MAGRRDFVKAAVSAAAAGVLPANFAGCGLAGAVIVDSNHRPTPEAPLTPADDFYVNANYGLPAEIVTPERYRLHVRGLVDREVAIDFASLLALPQVEQEITLECIGNTPGGGLISSNVFRGPLLRDAIAMAGLSERAFGLRLVGLEGYSVTVSTRVLEESSAIVAHSLAGEPLTLAHGAPLRVLFPSRYGMFSVKWLDSIVATRDYVQYGSLEGLSDSIEGTKGIRSRFDEPFDGALLVRGERALISGLAVTAGTGLARVEVNTDGTWRPAELTFNTLDDARSSLLWSLWRFEWTPQENGVRVLAVRAFDVRGNGQRDDPGFPYDGSAIHSVRVLVHD